jgi:arylsulfatase B
MAKNALLNGWLLYLRTGDLSRTKVSMMAWLLLFAFFEMAGMSPSFAASPQNVLLIIADDYGSDSSSLYNSTSTGASLPPTPNIASLAQNGVVFRNAYANPLCSPTRACLITGRFGFRTGIGDVVTTPTSAMLTASEFTLPEAFAANSSLGYQLAHFGKWHLNNATTSPNSIGGWPHFAGSLIGQIQNYTNWTKTVDGSSSTSTTYATTDLVNDAIVWIQTQGSKPWFAWIAFNAPHTPFHKPPNSLCPHYTSLSGTTADINAHPRSYYEAATEAMDTEIGRLLASVNRTNTHIIFLGDNGTPGQVIQPPSPSSRGKNTLYEGGTHVPFIIAGPSVVNPGRTNDTLVNMVDVFATILEMAGINVASTVPSGVTIDSKSLLPIVQSNSNQTRYAYAELFGPDVTASLGGKSLRNSQYKLIRFSDNRNEFYDLSTDPYETVNLLNGTLAPTQQANYYSLLLRLAGYQTALASPAITTFTKAATHADLTVSRSTNYSYTLWRAASSDELAWAPLTNAIVITNGTTSITLTDPAPSPAQSFYRVLAGTP